VPLPHLEYWIIAQLALEVVLLLFLVYFLFRLRRMNHRFREAETQPAAALAKLSAELGRLEEKRLALEQALAEVERKALHPEGRGISPQAAAGRRLFPEQGGQGLSLRSQVEELHLQGLSVAEIAQRLGLHPTEVKMALDLTRLSSELP
jgi:hypothetical protein